jgi:hypothetical protein
MDAHLAAPLAYGLTCDTRVVPVPQQPGSQLITMPVEKSK